MRIKPHLSPPHGYTFRDQDGVLHRGDSWAHLVRVVAQYRAVSGKPPGNPEIEITEAVCGAAPELCATAGPSALGGGDQEGFHLRIQNFLATLLEKVRLRAISWVTSDRAHTRADICRTCRFQQAWQKGCVACRKSTETTQDRILRSRPDVGRDLLGCGILQEDTRTSIHLDLPAVRDDRLPRACWRRS